MRTLMVLGAALALGSSAYATTLDRSLQGGTLEVSDLSHQSARHWKKKLRTPSPDRAFTMAIRFKNPGQPGTFKKK